MSQVRNEWCGVDRPARCRMVAAMKMLLRMALMAGLFASLPLARAAAPVTWPVPPCGPADIATASPAPLPSDTAALAELPFVARFAPASAALVVGLADDNTPIIRCIYWNERSEGLEGAAVVAVAGLRFSTPRVPNTVVKGGRYLVRVSTLLGFSWVQPPPRQPLLPPCPPRGATAQTGVRAPKPVSRVAPVYPSAAENEAIEGAVEVWLDVFADGSVSPYCIASASPPGWFERATVDAVAQWRFDPPIEIGPRRYWVTVKFRMEN